MLLEELIRPEARRVEAAEVAGQAMPNPHRMGQAIRARDRIIGFNDPFRRPRLNLAGDLRVRKIQTHLLEVAHSLLRPRPPRPRI